MNEANNRKTCKQVEIMMESVFTAGTLNATQKKGFYIFTVAL